MVLAIEELSALEDEIMSVLPDRITAILSKLNRSGRLEELLELLGMEDLLKQEQDFYSYKEGKIVVVGGTDVKEEVLLSIAKNLGIDKADLSFVLSISRYRNLILEECSMHRNIESYCLDQHHTVDMEKVTVEVLLLN